MRYVLVWFTCSVEGCEAKAEQLLAARLVVGSKYANQVGMVAKKTRLTLRNDDLPEGWGTLSEVPDRFIRDRERTFCPEHCKR